jgi:hypothetical protein
MCFVFIMRINSDLCHLHDKLIVMYNREGKYLLRGTDWVCTKSSLRFVFKGLNWPELDLNTRLCIVSRLSWRPFISLPQKYYVTCFAIIYQGVDLRRKVPRYGSKFLAQYFSLLLWLSLKFR